MYENGKRTHFIWFLLFFSWKMTINTALHRFHLATNQTGVTVAIGLQIFTHSHSSLPSESLKKNENKRKTSEQFHINNYLFSTSTNKSILISLRRYTTASRTQFNFALKLRGYFFSTETVISFTPQNDFSRFYLLVKILEFFFLSAGCCCCSCFYWNFISTWKGDRQIVESKRLEI